ncbi:hypothetical protein OIU34_16070 [Pararhizobium sp. BT-229]|uniref:hypothetical protein n=1 Tax=Pararhizobium sp. BT-229 TaxID=2986923 RepID=UPI0021F6FD1C|nr:hypothetical protein [Pararhizobium sp. BT-229]MCV9963421.1 hypothetical protein [Pararhizobium sp. BT-229]
MRRMLLLMVGLCSAFPASAADGWSSYSNPRFGYSAEVPPGFTLERESDNGDGASFRSEDGRSRLLLFGATVEDDDFASEVHRRIGWDRDKGWEITYDKVTPGWASYSGSRSADILYVRGVALCDGSAAYFHIEYPHAVLKAFNSVVSRMVDGLRPAAGCNRAPQGAPDAAQQ